MGAILNWAKDKENSSKNEQTRSSIDHTFSSKIVSCPVKKMAFVMIFWATYIPFVILLLSLVGRYAMRALGRLRFERARRDGSSPTLAIPRAASAYVGAQSRSTSRFPPDGRHT
jgi:hypothetical protein